MNLVNGQMEISLQFYLVNIKGLIYKKNRFYLKYHDVPEN